MKQLASRGGRHSARAPIRNVQAGASLFFQIHSLCHVGIELREEGWCLGLPRIRDLHVTDNGTLLYSGDTGAARRATRRFNAHLRLGHDVGCGALGVPERLLAEAVKHWDTAGAATYLQEALREVMVELDGAARVGQWSGALAREAVDYALVRRMSPVRCDSG